MKKLMEELARKLSEHESKKSSGPKVEIEIESKPKGRKCPKCGCDMPEHAKPEESEESESVVG